MPVNEPRIELRKLPWRDRLAFVVETMKEVSRQVDPQQMVQVYSRRMRQVIPSDANLSLSRRGLKSGQVRITRSSRFTESVNPWKHGDRLPLIEGGLLARLIYGDELVVIDDLHVSESDPGYSYLAGYRSLVAIPLYDGGLSLNMVVLLQKEPAGYDMEALPEHVWLANLFGRATTNLVLGNQVKEAYDAVDRELKAVADIQRSLLPAGLPDIPGLDVAPYYQTSRRAGGDYYDFFALPDGRWGLFMADVSGHGTPAAVLMAITHSIAHTFSDPKAPPGKLLAFVNERLARAYTVGTGNFVTAFYGIWDPNRREFAFASAGHPPPRLRTAAGKVMPLEGASGLPLGILDDEVFDNNVRQLSPGDTLLLYTDGITEARNPAGAMYETDRLDAVLSERAATSTAASELLDDLLADLNTFADGRPAGDDRTLLIVRVC
jgi:sigma-B regulation protein RsbU (phosphoserine phosphatase)